MAKEIKKTEPDPSRLTIRAGKVLSEITRDPAFADDDSAAIYAALRSRIQPMDFGYYLRRCVHRIAGYGKPMDQVPPEDYADTVLDAFAQRGVPVSIRPTKTKPRAAVKNWLTQKSVSREAVMLLGFGLGLRLEDVNELLTKGLLEDALNPKDPTETICWYCLRRGEGYYRFRALLTAYEALPGSTADAKTDATGTMVLRGEVEQIRDERGLMKYLNRLRRPDGSSRQSVEARRQFDALYNEARAIIARLNNGMEEEQIRIRAERLREALSRNDRYYDDQKQGQVRNLMNRRKKWRPEDITPVSFEEVLFAAVPKDRHGNMLPMKASSLNDAFRGKRLNRQHIQQILEGSAAISRYDLVTMSFFVVCQQTEDESGPNRYRLFSEKTNAVLARCGLNPLYPPNPYEAFLMMCTLTEYPLGTYADVWERSYEPEEA